MAKSGIPIPKGRLSSLVKSVHVYDIVIAFCTLIAAIVSACKLLSEGWGWFFFIPALIGFGCTIIKCVLNYQKDSGLSSLHSLEGCLYVARSVIIDSDNITFGIDPKLRITVHVPSDDKKSLIQVIEYIGDQRRVGTVGRRTRSNCGIIGLAFRKKELLVACRETSDHESYVAELIDKWHYTDDEARKLDPSSMSWMAIPLTNSNEEVMGIVFADSVVPDFFTLPRQTIALSAVVGIAGFVRTKLT